MNRILKISILFLLCISLFLTSGCMSITVEPKAPSEVNIETTSPTETGTQNENSAESEPLAIPESTDNTAEITGSIPSIAETLIYDENNIRITAIEIEESWLGYEIKLLIENNSSENILVTTESLSINGYMSALSSLYANVLSGKKSYESISLSSTTMDQANITTISNIQFYIDISNADSWDSLYTSELITLHTSAKDHVQTIDDSGEVVYEDNGIRVVCKGLKQDILWDGTVVFFIENKSGKDITVYAEDVSVNGFMCNASLWTDLRADTVAIDGLTLTGMSDIDINDINDVSNVEFTLRFVNDNDWLDSYSSDVISLNF